MSEELLQTQPLVLGRYSYLKIGNSSLAQLRKAKVISGPPTKHERKKPDGLILGTDATVKAFIEYKQPSEFKSAAQKKKAVDQELDVAKALCKVYIVTDGQTTLWINSLTGEPIRRADGSVVSDVVDVQGFYPGGLTAEKVKQFEDLIDMADVSLTDSNNIITPPKLLDPTPLAQALWQLIWINTGKEPEKCLYNVVELFVFKFLSDLKVLKDPYDFATIYRLRRESAESALKQYAQSSRGEIRSLFPAGEDRTTIINGTIFVNEKGEANVSQAGLFGEVLDHLEAFDKAHGSFRHIQRDFKTRLYESFLRQSAGVKSLGQYFTPRNVVRAMVRMSNAASLGKGARIADPFCGVGGFVLETIVGNAQIYREYEPKNGRVTPEITVIGYDKGTDEKEDERTIILAKANMLIYFSDLLAMNHTPETLKSFSSGAFNSVFHLLRTNLGTFAQVSDEPYDLILTNPPYVTSGVGSIRRSLDEKGLAAHYTVAGRGTEALAIEWIARNLKPGGQALVVVPDGLLIQKPVLEFLRKTCRVQGIISLPLRTFYSTAKKTFILALTRLHPDEKPSEDPVFTYLVSEIGESRDNYRFPITQNDLETAADLFNQFKGAPGAFKTDDKRCKIVPPADFAALPNWLIDRQWSVEEKAELGIVDQATEYSEEEFLSLVNNAQALLADYAARLSGKD